MSKATVPVKVFLVDDSDLICRRVAEQLSAIGMSIVGQAQTPHDAIAGISQTLPDVVVLDVQLQGGSGLQVLRTLRQALPQIAFIVFSNNAGPAYRRRYLKEGATRFLDKSHEFNELVTAVTAAASQTSYQQ